MTTIFTATLGTESNTFSALPTGLQLFQDTCLFRKRGYGDKVPMFAAPLDVWHRLAEAKGWRVVESLCAFAMPAGKTVKAVYEAFRDEILADLKAAMPVDAVLLSLHGAMVAEGYDDAEAESQVSSTFRTTRSPRSSTSPAGRSTRDRSPGASSARRTTRRGGALSA